MQRGFGYYIVWKIFIWVTSFVGEKQTKWKIFCTLERNTSSTTVFCCIVCGCNRIETRTHVLCLCISNYLVHLNFIWKNECVSKSKHLQEGYKLEETKKIIFQVSFICPSHWIWNSIIGLNWMWHGRGKNFINSGWWPCWGKMFI